MSTTKKKTSKQKQPARDIIADAEQAMEQSEKPQIAAHELAMQIAHEDRQPDERERQFLSDALDVKPYKIRDIIEQSRDRLSNMRAAGTQDQYQRAQQAAEQRRAERDEYEQKTVQPLRDQLAQAESRLQDLDEKHHAAVNALQSMQHARAALRLPSNLPAPHRAQAERLLNQFKTQGPPAQLREIHERLGIVQAALQLPALGEIEYQSNDRRRLEAYLASLPANHPCHRREVFQDRGERDKQNEPMLSRDFPKDAEWQQHIAELQNERDQLLERRKRVEAEQRSQREQLNESMDFWIDRIEQFIAEPTEDKKA